MGGWRGGTEVNFIRRVIAYIESQFPAPGLTFAEKLSLALPGPALSLGGVLIHNVFIKYYTDIVGLESKYVAIVYVIYNIWNAINDPIIGAWLDKMKYRPKRGKYVYVMRVTVPVMVFFAFLMVLSSPSWDQWMIFLIYTVELFVYDTAETSYKLAYTSYQLILAPTTEERIEVNILVRYISQFMSFFITMIPTLLLVGDGNRAVIIPIFTLVILGQSLFFIFALRGQKENIEMYETVQRLDYPTKEIGKEMLRIIKTRPFITYVTFSILIGHVYFYYTPFIYYMDSVMNTTGFIAVVVDTTVTIAVLLLLPLIGRIASTLGTKISVYWGVIPAFLGYGGFFFATNIWVAALAYFFIIFTVNYFQTVMTPIGPLLIDEDERRTGVRKTGLFNGLFAIFGDAFSSVQSFAFLTVISVFGYDGLAQVQSDSAVLGIRVATALIPLAAVLLGLIAIFLYPFDKEEEAELSEFSRQARQGDNTLDEVSGNE